MRNTYPIVLTETREGIVVYIPDFDIYTQGADITEAIFMARDAIGLKGIDMEDDKIAIPSSSKISDIKVQNSGDIITLVDIDFADYRRKNELKTVKKNCTLPSWLCYEAEKANINFSQILQTALKKELRIND